MDETGCLPSDQGTECVCGSQGMKTQHKQGGANHESVTAICANGVTLHSTVILKGQNFISKWASNNVYEAS